jgi:hypothetical protein
MMDSPALNHFRSMGDYYQFALLYTDGDLRNRLLEIHNNHYLDDEVAALWYLDIKRIVMRTPDTPVRAEAMAKLNTIYARMLGQTSGERHADVDHIQSQFDSTRRA